MAANKALAEIEAHKVMAAIPATEKEGFVVVTIIMILGVIVDLIEIIQFCQHKDAKAVREVGRSIVGKLRVEHEIRKHLTLKECIQHRKTLSDAIFARFNSMSDTDLETLITKE